MCSLTALFWIRTANNHFMMKQAQDLRGERFYDWSKCSDHKHKQDNKWLLLLTFLVLNSASWSHRTKKTLRKSLICCWRIDCAAYQLRTVWLRWSLHSLQVSSLPWQLSGRYLRSLRQTRVSGAGVFLLKHNGISCLLATPPSPGSARCFGLAGEHSEVAAGLLLESIMTKASVLLGR